MNAPEYLIEIAAWVGDAEKVLRVGTCGYNTGPGDNPPNAHYLDVVADPGSFVRHLFGPARTTGRSEVSYGEIQLSNANGELDGWIDYGFDGRSVLVKRLSSRRAPYSSAITVLRGTVERLDADNAWLGFRLRFYDRRRSIDKPIQENVYAGTTISAGPTAEGNLDLKDSVKPLCFGHCLNVPPALANAFNLIYQVHDGAVSSIAVYDGGVPLTLGVNHANIAALQGATIRPGRFDTCLALGLLRLGGSPAFVVTADVLEGATAAARYPGAVVRRMLAKMGLTGSGNVNVASFNALDASAQMEVGIWLDTQTAGLAAMGDVLASVGGWIIPGADGAFEAGRLLAPGVPVGNINDDDMLKDSLGIITSTDTDGGLPAWRVVLEYARNWQVQDDAQLGGCVEMARRAFLAAEMREEKVENDAVRVKHLLAPEMRVSTFIVDQEAAEAEADRWLDLYSVRRDILSFAMNHADADAFQLGKTVKIVLPRWGYEAGRNMVVIGREETLRDYTVTLTVWG